MTSSISDFIPQSSQEPSALHSFIGKGGGKDSMREIFSFFSFKEEQGLSLVDKKMKEIVNHRDSVFYSVMRKIERQDALILPREEKRSLKSSFAQKFKNMPSAKTWEELQKQEKELQEQKKECKLRLSGNKEVLDDQVRFFDAFFRDLHERYRDELFRETEELNRIDEEMRNNPDLRNNRALFISAVKSGNFMILNRMQLMGTVEEKLEFFASAIHLLGLQNRYRNVTEVIVFARAIFGGELEEILSEDEENRQTLRNLIDQRYQYVLDRLFEYLDDGGQIPSQEEIIDIRNPPSSLRLTGRAFRLIGKGLGRMCWNGARYTVQHPVSALGIFARHQLNTHRRIFQIARRHPRIAATVVAGIATQAFLSQQQV